MSSLILRYTVVALRGRRNTTWAVFGQEEVHEAGRDLLCLPIAADHIREDEVREVHAVPSVPYTAVCTRRVDEVFAEVPGPLSGQAQYQLVINGVLLAAIIKGTKDLPMIASPPQGRATVGSVRSRCTPSLSPPALAPTNSASKKHSPASTGGESCGLPHAGRTMPGSQYTASLRLPHSLCSSW